MKDKEIKEIPISEIEIGFNPRESFDEDLLEELATSIERDGQRNPIIVVDKEDLKEEIREKYCNKPEKKYYLIDGERRIKAIKRRGGTKATAIIKEVESMKQVEIESVLSNKFSKKLAPLEQGNWANHYVEECNGTKEEAAEVLGVSVETIKNYMSRAKRTPKEILKHVHSRMDSRKKGFSSRQAWKISKPIGEAYSKERAIQISNELLGESGKAPSNDVIEETIKKAKKEPLKATKKIVEEARDLFREHIDLDEAPTATSTQGGKDHIEMWSEAQKQLAKRGWSVRNNVRFGNRRPDLVGEKPNEEKVLIVEAETVKGIVKKAEKGKINFHPEWEDRKRILILPYSLWKYFTSTIPFYRETGKLLFEKEAKLNA